MLLRDVVNACELHLAGTYQWEWSHGGVDHGSNFTRPIDLDPRVHFCRYQYSDGPDSWYNFKFGPFTSLPGVTFRFPFQPIPQFDDLPFRTIGLQAMYQVFLRADNEHFISEDELIVHHQNLFDVNSHIDWALLKFMSNETAFEGTYAPATMQPGTRGEHWGVTAPVDCPYCYYSDFGAGYAKPLVRGPEGYPFVTDGYLVDVRPKASPAFSWFYQVGWKLVEGSNLTAHNPITLLSEHQLWNPTNVQAVLPTYDQSLFFLFSSEPHFLYYSGRWPVTGRMYPAGIYLHTHLAHRESYLFSAAPDALGLGVPPLVLQKSCLPTRVNDTEHLKATLRSNCPTCFERKLICYAQSGHTSCKPWLFVQGDIFTSFSLYGTKTTLQFPQVQHLVWYIRFIAAGDVSPLTWNIYHTRADDTPALFKLDYVSYIYYYLMASLTSESAYACGPDERPEATKSFREMYSTWRRLEVSFKSFGSSPFPIGIVLLGIGLAAARAARSRYRVLL